MDFRFKTVVVLGAILVSFGVVSGAVAQTDKATVGPSYVFKDQQSGSSGSHGNTEPDSNGICHTPSDGGSGSVGPTINSTYTDTQSSSLYYDGTLVLAGSTGGNGGSGGALPISPVFPAAMAVAEVPRVAR